MRITQVWMISLQRQNFCLVSSISHTLHRKISLGKELFIQDVRKFYFDPSPSAVFFPIVCQQISMKFDPFPTPNCGRSKWMVPNLSIMSKLNFFSFVTHSQIFVCMHRHELISFDPIFKFRQLKYGQCVNMCARQYILRPNSCAKYFWKNC